jgi:hypothetical protein
MRTVDHVREEDKFALRYGGDQKESWPVLSGMGKNYSQTVSTALAGAFNRFLLGGIGQQV